MKEIITKNFQETQKMGEGLAGEILKDQKRSDRSRPKQPKAVGPLVICLSGDLGSGKTTFTQGLLKGLGAEGPYTSPTFMIMKHYKSEPKTKNQKPKTIYHIDAYRINSKDILDLGWEEIISNPESIVIIEWADRICDIIPKDAIWIEFEFINENKRKIIFKN